MGLGRLELPTSRLSGVRSSQLSYRPTRRRGRWAPGGKRKRKATKSKLASRPCSLLCEILSGLQISRDTTKSLEAMFGN